MSEGNEKICLICGINMNKRPRHDRYNYVHPSRRKMGKGPADESTPEESDSDSDNYKSKRKSVRKKPVAAPSGRQTRNRNPKAFAASLCRTLRLPDTQDHPFLRIFSNADYCDDCKTKVKDIHESREELEKIQSRLDEYKMDIELDLSKHLQKIPVCENLLQTDVFSRYKEDINLILDFKETEKQSKGEGKSDDEEEESKKRNYVKRKAETIGSHQLRTREAKKQKVYKEESDSSDKSEDEEEKPVKSKPPKKEEPSYEPEDSKAEEIEEEAADCSETVEKVEDNGGSSSPEILSEVEGSSANAELSKPKERTKRDPSLKCTYCTFPRYFTNHQNLAAHILVHQQKRKTFDCEFCGKKFDRPNRLQIHMSKAHPNGEKDGGESDGTSAKSGWICGFCDQEFERKKLMEDHLDEHPEAKPLNCHACGGSFKRLDSLQRGFQIFKGQPVDPCPKCGKKIALKDYVAHNEKIHGIIDLDSD